MAMRITPAKAGSARRAGWAFGKGGNGWAAGQGIALRGPGSALGRLTWALERLPGFAPAPFSISKLTSFPGPEAPLARPGLPCRGEQSLGIRLPPGGGKLAKRRLFSASHNVHSRFRANSRGGATFFYNSHLPN